MYFVHVYWSPDEKKVGVLATGLNIWNIAWDLTLDRGIPFDSIKPDVRRSIEESYRVPSGEDAILWAASSDAQSAFFRLHPDIKSTYR